MFSGLVDRMNHIIRVVALMFSTRRFLLGSLVPFLFEDLLGLLEGYFGRF